MNPFNRPSLRKIGEMACATPAWSSRGHALKYTLINKELFGSVRSQDTQVRRPVQHVLGGNNLPFEICGTAEVKIEVHGITAPHEVYVCENVNQKIRIGVDFLNSHGRVMDSVREAIESRVH